MTDTKIETIQEMYAAFGRGDVQTIINMLTDDVDWSAESAAIIAPWHGRCNGKNEVPRFFEGIGKATEVTEFTPLSFGSNDTDVFATIKYGFTSRETGKSAMTTLHHWFRFRGDKIYFVRSSEDTAQLAATLSI
jgi:ketosteroid isomerase-like protein